MTNALNTFTKQHYSNYGHGRVEVGLDVVGVMPDLQSLVTRARERGRDGRTGHIEFAQFVARRGLEIQVHNKDCSSPGYL